MAEYRRVAFRERDICNTDIAKLGDHLI